MPRTEKPREDPALVVLFGKTRRRLLAWLFLHPDDAFYVRQLVRIVGGSPGAVPRELERLRTAGLLRRTRKGRRVFYQADRDAAIFPHLRALVARTLEVTRS
jgi:DNA-binding transcriptional ArsR family regulator